MAHGSVWHLVPLLLLCLELGVVLLGHRTNVEKFRVASAFAAHSLAVQPRAVPAP